MEMLVRECDLASDVSVLGIQTLGTGLEVWLVLSRLCCSAARRAGLDAFPGDDLSVDPGNIPFTCGSWSLLSDLLLGSTQAAGGPRCPS